MIYLFILLQLLDIYTTYTILNKGGVELNSVMSEIFKKIGVLPGLVLTKSLAIAGVWYIQEYTYVVMALCVIYVGVVINNSYQLLRYRK